MKTIIFNSAIAEISVEDFYHPGLRKVKFVFCDDQPNENGQGILAEDFDDIIKSAIGAPVKMKFFGQSAGNHLGSIPIGHIFQMTKEIDEAAGITKLVADAILYQDDYPEEVEYLAHTWAEGRAPGVSWELSYKDSILERGTNWLKGVITRAATFVRSPAYGNRTAILALASNTHISEEDLLKEISGLNADTSPKNNEQGGNNRMEEEIKRLQAEIDALKEAHSSELSTRDSKITELETKVTVLEASVSEKDTALAEYQQKELLATRITELAEAGITLPTEAEKRAAKEAFYLSLSDEAFASVKAELVEAIAAAKVVVEPKKGLASLQSRTVSVPKPSAGTEDTETLSLAEKFRSISRTRDTQSE